MSKGDGAEKKKGLILTAMAYNNAWHTDITFQEVPPSLAMLYAKQPLGNGLDDTLFCNMVNAYKSLSPGLQDLLEGLNAVHTARNLAKAKHNNAYRTSNLGVKVPLDCLHPCVRVHPETSHPSLFVNLGFVDRFEGWTSQETRPMLEYLVRHATQDSNVYRHTWEQGDLVCWDNRCTMHNAEHHLYGKGTNLPDAIRIMRRLTATPHGETRPVGMGGRVPPTLLEFEDDTSLSSVSKL